MSINAPIPIRPIAPGPHPSLLADALELARAHAYEMGEDGCLDFADPDTLERFLVERPGTLRTRARDWEARMTPVDVRARRRGVAGLGFVGARFSLDYSLTDAMGTQRHVREIAEAIACADGRATLIRGVILDRTTEARADAATVWQARHDGLTRLPNVDAAADAAAMLAALADRLGLRAHLMRLRLTELDRLTRHYGPDLGDRLLRAVARRLQDVVAAPDLVVRLDGPDFALLWLEAQTQAQAQADTGAGADDPAGVEIMADRIEAAMDAPFETPFGPLSPGLAVASAPLGGADRQARRSPDPLEAALAATDAALDDPGPSTPTTPSASRPPLPLTPTTTPEAAVQAALADDRLRLAFQPIVHAVSGDVHHHEALLRLRADTGELSSAWQLILQAERIGRVDRLDRRALDLAVPYLQADDTLRLALNVSAGTIGDAQASAAYLAAIRALGPIAARLTLEMTETLAVDDPATAAAFSAEARSLGCRFAVDDFGSGHTTFRNLLAVEADCIKIDGSLVRGVAVDDNKQAFIRMMVDLAQTFSVETVAEMIEDRADALILARLGVDYLQGYYFGRPSPVPAPALSPNSRQT